MIVKRGEKNRVAPLGERKQGFASNSRKVMFHILLDGSSTIGESCDTKSSDHTIEQRCLLLLQPLSRIDADESWLARHESFDPFRQSCYSLHTHAQNCGGVPADRDDLSL